jgi:hypothetical protein
MFAAASFLSQTPSSSSGTATSKNHPHPCHYYMLVFLKVSTDIKTMHHNVESSACGEKTIRIVGFGGTKGKETYSA